MSMLSNLRSLFVPPLRMAGTAGAGPASPAALDGRNFDGIVLKCGETSGDADTLSFKDGRFRSSACDPYGYGDGAYTATQSGEAIAFEQKGTGVTANCLAPGALTRLAKESHARFEAMHEAGQISDDDWDRFLDQPPPDYVAPIVAWLCSDAAAMVSGEVFHATGGLVARWTSYEDERGVYRGDHRSVAPWTLDELDSVVPKMLL